MLVVWSAQLLAAMLLFISASQHLKLLKQHTSPLSIDTIIATQSPHWDQKCSTTSQYHSCTSESKWINMFDYEGQLECLFQNLWRCRWAELWKIIFLIKRISEAHLSSSTPKREHLLLLSTITVPRAHMCMHSQGHVHGHCSPTPAPKHTFDFNTIDCRYLVLFFWLCIIAFLLDLDKPMSKWSIIESGIKAYSVILPPTSNNH